MLPQFYKIALVNNTAAPLDYDGGGRLKLKQTAWYIDPTTGKITYAPLPDEDFGFTAGSGLADGIELLSSGVDNTSTLYLGSQIQIEVTHDSGTPADGTFDIYPIGGDADGELVSDADGYNSAEGMKLTPLASMTWDTNAVNGETLRSPVISYE